MNIYVWRGPNTLRNFSRGMVVIAAHTIDAAWDKLKQADFWVYMWLKTGKSYYFDEWAVESADPDERSTWEETPYEVFSIEALPVLYLSGGE